MTIETDPEPAPVAAQDRRAIRLLAIGAAIGLALAASDLLQPIDRGRDDLPDDVAALVNGTPIRSADYERVLAGLASDSRNPIDDAARRHVLDRMIDEELLVQRALALGLAQSDRRVRADLTSGLIASVVDGADDRDPRPGELEAFLIENADFFTQPGRHHVRQIFFRVPRPEDEAAQWERAQAAHAALVAGESFDAVAARYGDQPVSPLPAALLPPLKLREYVGPTALEAVLALERGGFSAPIRSGVGIHVLELVDVRPAVTPALADIEATVEAEWRRRKGERALRDYLDELRAGGHVVARQDLE